MEIWKKIEDFENYSVSSEGRVRHDKKGNLKKPHKTRCGYYTMFLDATKSNVRKSFYVHRLVAQAFFPNPNNYKEVNHLNGIKTDNRVENLEWCDRSHNIKHAFEKGLYNSRKGIENNLSVLSEYEVLEIRRLRIEGWSQYKLAEKFGVTRPNITSIVNRKSWTHI